VNARRGLKRDGFRRYLVRGPLGEFAIDREGPRRFDVRRASAPRSPGFFAMRFRLLRDARAHAEKMAGVQPRPWDPALDLPKFLDRRAAR